MSFQAVVPSPHRSRSRLLAGLVVLALLPATSGCAALSSLASLTQVGFSLSGVSRVDLAGVDLSRVQSYEDLSTVDALRVGTALARGELPLQLTLDVRADNPQGNPEARLLGLDWELFLEGQSTVSGGLGQALVLPSGAITPVPVTARLDLLEFFDGGARELVNLAAGLAGIGGAPVAVRLDATPTVDTPLGPIRYPRPLTLGVTAGATPTS